VAAPIPSTYLSTCIPSYQSKLANSISPATIKGFAAKAETATLESVIDVGSRYRMEVEEDGDVAIRDEE
jgi:hypothetical protein